jgi:hypothetical protein
MPKRYGMCVLVCCPLLTHASRSPASRPPRRLHDPFARLPLQVSARIVGALVRTLKVTAKSVASGMVPFAGAGALDPSRARLRLPAGDDAWPPYFFPELLRYSRTGDLASRKVDPRNPSVWSGRVAGVQAAGHILFREGGGSTSVRNVQWVYIRGCQWVGMGGWVGGHWALGAEDGLRSWP